jgi:hypothetical protein
VDDYYENLDKDDHPRGRLQLYTKGRAVDRHITKAGHYGIAEGHGEIVDLGASIDVLALARRPQAVDMGRSDALIVSYDPDTVEFRRITAEALEQESHCMFGVSFLIYEKSSRRFLEFFCGSKSFRVVAKAVFPFLPLTAGEIEIRKLIGVEPHGPVPFSFETKVVTKGKFSWHVPEVAKCRNKFGLMPPQNLIDEQIADFVSVIGQSPAGGTR